MYFYFIVLFFYLHKELCKNFMAALGHHRLLMFVSLECSLQSSEICFQVRSDDLR